MPNKFKPSPKFKLGSNPLNLRQFNQPSESTYVQPAVNKLERDLEVSRINADKIKQREKELTEHYSKPNMVFGMKRRPTASEITQKATASVDYNNRLRNDPVGTLGPDIAMALIPEAMFLKTPQQLISKGLKKINPFTRLSNKEVYNPNLLTELRKELADNGILRSQKTLNLPYKEPIRKGIEPWGYSDNVGNSITGSKFKDVKGAIFGGKNPLYRTEEAWKLHQDEIRATNKKLNINKNPILNKEWSIDYQSSQPPLETTKSLKEAINIRDRMRIPKDKTRYSTSQSNRYTTWDMYLGKPQTKHPMYDVSDLTKSKNDIIYTIKEDFMNKPLINRKFDEMIDNINNLESDKIPEYTKNITKEYTKNKNAWKIQDHDNDYFGTMGGFHWDVNKMADGNYKIYANDIWDLQPFGNNIEIGKALGIGKPLNVKVGFIVDGKTKNIINTFGLTPGVIGTTNLLNNSDTNDIPKLKDGGIPKLKSTNMKTNIQVKRLNQTIPKLSIGGIAANVGSATLSGLSMGGPWGAAIGGAFALAGGISGELAEKKQEKLAKEQIEKQNRKTMLAGDASRLANHSKYGYNQSMYLNTGGIPRLKNGGIPRLNTGGKPKTAYQTYKEIEKKTNTPNTINSNNTKPVVSADGLSKGAQYRLRREQELAEKARKDAYKLQYPTSIAERSVGNIANLATLDIPRMTGQAFSNLVDPSFYKNVGAAWQGNPLAMADMEERVKKILPTDRRYQEIENNNGIDGWELAAFAATPVLGHYGGKAIGWAAPKVGKLLPKSMPKFIKEPVSKYITEPYKEGLKQGFKKSTTTSSAATPTIPASTVSAPISNINTPINNIPIPNQVSNPVVNLFEATNNPVVKSKAVPWLTRQLNKLSKGGIPRLAKGGVPEVISGGRIKKLDNNLSIVEGHNPSKVDGVLTKLKTPKGKAKAFINHKEVVVNDGKQDVVISAEDSKNLLDKYVNVPNRLKKPIANMFAQNAINKQAMLQTSTKRLSTAGIADDDKPWLSTPNGFPIAGYTRRELNKLNVSQNDNISKIPNTVEYNHNTVLPNPVQQTPTVFTEQTNPTRTTKSTTKSTIPVGQPRGSSDMEPLIRTSPNIGAIDITNKSLKGFAKRDPKNTYIPIKDKMVNREFTKPNPHITIDPPSKIAQLASSINIMSPDKKANAANIALGGATVINNMIAYSKLGKNELPELRPATPILEDVNANATIHQNQRDDVSGHYKNLFGIIDSNSSSANSMAAKLGGLSESKYRSLDRIGSAQIADMNTIRNRNVQTQNAFGLQNNQMLNNQLNNEYGERKGFIQAGLDFNNSSIKTMQNIIDSKEMKRMDNKALSAIALQYGIPWKPGDPIEGLLAAFQAKLKDQIDASKPTGV